MSIRVGTTAALITAINSTEKLIYINQGTYNIDASTTSLISNVLSRKIQGSGIVNLVFTNIPNGTSSINPKILLDLQNKTRIYNINIRFNSFKSNNPQNIIGVRFKRKIISSYVGIGTTSTLPTITTNTDNQITINIAPIPRIISSSELQANKYYCEILNLNATNSKERSIFYVLEKDDADNYVWVQDSGSDEADMDSSITSCSFTSPSSINSESVVAIDYHGRNMECDQCTFRNIGTSIKLQFPPTNSLTSPSSRTNPSQSGYYGHRKCRIYRNIFENVLRCLHLTGKVTIRGMTFSYNTVNEGQLLYCDDDGGMKSSIISKNSVTNNNQTDKFSSVISLDKGLFVDNIISGNSFIGTSKYSVSIGSTININNIFSVNTFGDNKISVFNIRTSNSISIINNNFEGTSCPNLISIYDGGRNENISFNLLNNINPLTSINFINLITGLSGIGHTRIVVRRNKIKNSSNIRVISESTSSHISTPYFIQSSF